MLTRARTPIVVLVADEYPPYTAWGGVAYVMSHLARLLTESGHRVEIISLSDGPDEFVHLDACGNLVHRITPNRSWILKALKKLSPPLYRLACMGDMPFSLRVLEKTLELETLWNREICWIEATNWKAQTVLLQFMPKFNDRHAIRVVTPRAEVVKQNSAPKTRSVQAALLQEAVQQILVKHRFYSNEEYRPYFENLVRTDWSVIGRSTHEKVFLLPFDFSRIPPVDKVSAPADGVYRLLMLGRIEPRKGFEEVCSALASLSSADRAKIRVIAAGRDVPMGPLGSYIATLKAKFGEILDCFEFLGEVPDEEFKKLFATAHVGLMASRSESFGYNLVELLASNLPVISANVGACSELERRGVTYLTKYETVAELSSAFAELPARFAHYLREVPPNRPVLAEIYRANDSEYLELVESYFDKMMVRSQSTRGFGDIESVDVVICSYNRFDELTLSLGSVLTEVRRANEAGLRCTLTIVYQNEGLPESIYAMRGDLRGESALRFVESSPPSLTRARNVGVAATTGDLVIFVDDDVILEPGFVEAHVEAARRSPRAIGVVGHIQGPTQRGIRTKERAVGQIRMSGLIDLHFNSAGSTTTLVPITPMGANMAYRRAPMIGCFGTTWFDESLGGSAFREETTTAIELFRRGHHMVFAPDAALFHYEAVDGGCNNRSVRTIAQRITHFELDHLFLQRLYEGSTVLGAILPMWHVNRDMKFSGSMRDRIERAYVNLTGAARGRRRLRNSRHSHD